MTFEHSVGLLVNHKQTVYDSVMPMPIRPGDILAEELADSRLSQACAASRAYREKVRTARRLP